MKHQSWATAYDFLGDAFALACDCSNPEDVILVLKIDSDDKVLTLSVDGDLFCYINIKIPDKKAVRYHWQGRSRYKGMSIPDFIEELQSKLMAA